MKKPSGRAHTSKHSSCPARRCVPEATWVSLLGGDCGCSGPWVCNPCLLSEASACVKGLLQWLQMEKGVTQ